MPNHRGRRCAYVRARLTVGVRVVPNSVEGFVQALACLCPGHVRATIVLALSWILELPWVMRRPCGQWRERVATERATFLFVNIPSILKLRSTAPDNRAAIAASRIGCPIVAAQERRAPGVVTRVACLRSLQRRAREVCTKMTSPAPTVASSGSRLPTTAKETRPVQEPRVGLPNVEVGL
jgi:hypothetical protein